jgi:catechol 2,3-dioxygenase-like lactoylglutathione lyase family enzyme
MITRIAHVCLSVKNLEASLEFYESALGFSRRFSFIKRGKTVGVYLQIADRVYLEMFEKPGGAATNTGIVHICFETDDIDRAIQTLTSRGVVCSPKKLGADRSWQTWISDPDGNRIELHQYTNESSQRTGRDVEMDW